MVDLGQVFTKGYICQYMVSLLDLPKEASIMEPCFGDGAFLSALIDSDFINVTACEIDSKLFEKNQEKYLQYRLLNSDFLEYPGCNLFDGIIMNPPYVRQEKIDNLVTFGITKRKLRSSSIFDGLPSTANLYMYFIVKAIDLLKDGGQLVVIFPSSWMKAKSGLEFKKQMLNQCDLERQVHIKGDIFEKNALVDVVILKLIKGKANSHPKEEFLVGKEGELFLSGNQYKANFKCFSYPFSEIATVKRGLTTGCNEMYINPQISVNDESSVKRIVSSPKSVIGYTTKNAQLDVLFFPKKEKMSKKAAKYIEMWKKKILEERAPKSLYLKAQKNDNWFELRETCGFDILFSYFVRNDMKFIMNESGVIARDNFYVINSKIDKWVLFALLNNYYTYYQLELLGKKYGAGLLKLQRYDIEELMFPNYPNMLEKDKVVISEYAKNLVETGNSEFILKITQVLNDYSTINYQDIVNKYEMLKESRLEGK